MSDTALVKRLIRLHLGKIHSLQDVARLAGYSSETLRKDFIRREHKPLAAYIRIVRVERAKELLEWTDMTCRISVRQSVSRERKSAKEYSIPKSSTGIVNDLFSSHRPKLLTSPQCDSNFHQEASFSGNGSLEATVVDHHRLASSHRGRVLGFLLLLTLLGQTVAAQGLSWHFLGLGSESIRTIVVDWLDSTFICAVSFSDLSGGTVGVGHLRSPDCLVRGR